MKSSPQLIARFLVSRRFHYAAAATIALFALRGKWVLTSVPLIGSSNHAQIRVFVFCALAISLILGATLSVNLGEVERLRHRRLSSLVNIHLMAIVATLLLFAYLASGVLGVDAAQLFLSDSIFFLGSFAAAQVLLPKDMGWLVPVTVMLIMWMFGTEEPVNIPRDWAWLLPGAVAPYGLSLSWSLGVTGLLIWRYRTLSPVA
ncbi:MAG: hypothetical protein RL441_696 [Actinomycetota bacterium]